MSLSNKRDCADIWGSKPTALSRDEVSSLFKGLLSSENEARAEMDYSFIPEDGALFDRDVDYTMEQWRRGLIVPLSDDEIDRLVQKNVEATEDWIEGARQSYAERGEDLPDSFVEQAYQSLDFKNRYLINSAKFYRERAVNRERLDTMAEEDEEKVQTRSSSKRRRS